MEDLQARLEKLLREAEDCALLGKLATDVRKRDLFNKLATDLRRMARGESRQIVDELSKTTQAAPAGGLPHNDAT